MIRERLGSRYHYDYSYSNDECMTILLQCPPRKALSY